MTKLNGGIVMNKDIIQGVALTDEEYEVLIGARCLGCKAKLKDEELVLCEKCHNEVDCDINEEDLPF